MKMSKLSIVFGLLLISGCATNFGNHLELAIKSGQVSELGLAKQYAIVDADSSSRKINYAYGRLPGYAFEVLARSAFEKYAFNASRNIAMSDSAYAEYTKNRESVSDSTTKKLIAQRLDGIGMRLADEKQSQGVLLLSYEELMGWDMGEIVKEMRICGRVDSLRERYMDCASFSEMTMANSHPTREVVVNNLIALLLTNSWPQAAPTEKYKKNRVEK